MEPIGAEDPPWIGSFAVLGRLGAGGMGQVFLARSPGGRLVAVKTVHAELAADPRFRRRFAAEIAAMRRIGGFWTAAFVDADADAQTPWLATEYIAGPSLTQAVAAHGPLPESSARLLAAGLAESLAAIHAVGLVHRDLKPSNVLLAADGPRVIDFGIARMPAADVTALTQTGHLVGSPGFLSPEQAKGDEVGPAADVFGVGLVIAYATTGTSPFGAGDAAQLLFRVVYQDPRLDEVPEGLRPVAAACLRRDPAERPTPARILAMLDTPARAAVDDWLPAAHSALVRRRVGEADGVGADGARTGDSGAARDSGDAVTLSKRASVSEQPSTVTVVPGLPPRPGYAPGSPAMPGPRAMSGPPVQPTLPAMPPPAMPGLPVTPGPPVLPGPVPVPEGAPLPPAQPGIGRRRLLIGGAVVAAAAVGGTTYLLTRDGGGTANPASAGANSSPKPPAGTGSAPNVPQSSGGSAALPDKYRSAGAIVVGLDASYPPNEFLLGDGRIVGMTADLAVAIGKQLGIGMTLRSMPFSGLLSALSSGSVDLVMSSMADTKARQAQVDFVDYFSAGTAILVPKGNPRGIRSLAELCGCRVATQRGTVQEELAARASTRCGAAGALRITSFATLAEATIQIRKGAMDAGLFDYPISARAAAASQGALELVNGQIETAPYGIAVRKTDQRLRDAVKQALEGVAASGEYLAILTKCGMPEGALTKITVNGG
ncbi:protein kinase domain-containing protein [Embleya sp. AB8]|uniref:bifunctional serine/threonine-protein kinase/transporter substrate-binding domain-containing protein n=1 Tax=Embleya sp. AB8 TaxID=3156304 RepID=UPI003C729E0E